MFSNPSASVSSSRMIGIGDTGDKNIYVYNNLIDCGNSAIGIKAAEGGAISNLTVVNNAMRGCDIFGYYANVTVGTGIIDHNVYEGITASSDSFKWNNGYTSLSGMRATGLETTSTFPSNLGINTAGQPQSGSALIHNGTTNFPNLASLCSGNRLSLCSDYTGSKRAAAGSNNNWDAGAYVYGGGPARPTALVATAN